MFPPRLPASLPSRSGDSVATGAFAIAWNSFVAVWTISAVAGGGVLFGLFSLPFWAAGWQLAKQAFGRQFIRCVDWGHTDCMTTRVRLLWSMRRSKMLPGDSCPAHFGGWR